MNYMTTPTPSFGVATFIPFCLTRPSLAMASPFFMDTAFADIIGYFDRQDSLRRLRRSSVAKDALRSEQVYCHIVPVLPPLNTPGPFAGFSSSKFDPRPPTATLFIGSMGENPAIGVSMLRDGGSWSFRPCFIGDLNPAGLFVPFAMSWAEVLCRLSAKALLPLLRFQPKNPYIAAGIRSEINAKEAAFDYRGPFEFFPHQGDALAWIAATKWHSWEQYHLPQEDRLDHLSKFISHNLSSREYHELRPEGVAIKLAHGEKILPNFYGSPHSVLNLPRTASSALEGFNKVNAEAEMQSVGVGAKFHRPKAPSEKQLRNTAERHFVTTGIWWWRSLAQEPTRLSEFRNKWDRSAFFYEFRARQHERLAVEPSWDWQGLPWVELDKSQKGILHYLCPPEQLMEKQRILLKSAPQRKSLYSCEIFLARPWEEVFAEVRLLWEEANAHIQSRITVGDLKGPSHPTENPLNRTKSDLTSKWTLLEDLDVLRFMGPAAPRLSKGQDILRKREEKKYRSICDHAGILP